MALAPPTIPHCPPSRRLLGGIANRDSEPNQAWVITCAAKISGHMTRPHCRRRHLIGPRSLGGLQQLNSVM